MKFAATYSIALVVSVCVLLDVGCSDDSPPNSGSQTSSSLANTATVFAAASPTWNPAKGPTAIALSETPTNVPRPTRTGNTGVPQVDRIAELVAARDWGRLSDSINFTMDRCSVDVLSKQPRCPAGAADGDLVQAFRFDGCEGGLAPRWRVSEQLDSQLPRDSRLLEAYALSADGRTYIGPRSDYLLLFGTDGGPAITYAAIESSGLVVHFGGICGAIDARAFAGSRALFE